MADVIDAPLGSLLGGRQKFLLLNTLLLCAFMSALDSSIVATATPRILSDLGGFKLVSWLFTIYLLGSTIVLPIVGKLSDVFGRRLFLIAGLVIFVGSSALCGAAPTMPTLIVARGIQGIGGGMLTGVIFTTLGDLFTPIERARYMGYTTSAWTLAALIGPTVGGFLTDGPGWRWCFYINLPIGLAAMALILLKMPRTRRGGRLADIDFAGSALLSCATIALLLALAWANEEFGWSSPLTVGLLCAAAGLGAGFILNERGRANAIFPVDLFRNRSLMQADSMGFIQSIGMFGAVQYLPTFVQVSLGASATASGLVSTPQSVGLLVTCIVGGQLISRTGRFKYLMLLGAAFIIGAAFTLSGIGPGEPEWHIAALMIILGFGQGLIGPPNAVIVQASVSYEQMGVATSSRQFAQQIGQVLGVAVLGLIFTTTYSSSFSSRVPPPTREAITQDAYRQLEDPTVGLDKASALRIRTEALQAGAASAVVDQAFRAQKDAVATAIDRVFLIATGAGVALLLLALTTREIVLNDSFTVAAAEREQAPVLMH